MIKVVLIACGAVASSAAVANAGMSYEFSIAQLGHTIGAFQGSQEVFEYDSLFDALIPFTSLTSPTPFSYSRTIDPSGFNSLVSAQSTLNGVAQASSNRMEVTWNHHSSATLLNDATLSVGASSDPLVEGEITFSSAATIRMYFSGQGTGFGTDTGTTLSLAVGNHPLSPVPAFAHFSSTGGPVPIPFDIQFNVEAGDVLDISLGGSSDISNGTAANALGWDRSFSGSLIIEVIPAPSSVAALGLAGLFAARRRR